MTAIEHAVERGRIPSEEGRNVFGRESALCRIASHAHRLAKTATTWIVREGHTAKEVCGGMRTASQAATVARLERVA